MNSTEGVMSDDSLMDFHSKSKLIKTIICWKFIN